MTEHVQIELITAATVLVGQALSIWRSEVAAKRSRDAERSARVAAKRAKGAKIEAVKGNVAAAKAVVVATQTIQIATETRDKTLAAVHQIGEVVNGGALAAHDQIQSLKEQLVVAKASPAEVPADQVIAGAGK